MGKREKNLAQRLSASKWEKKKGQISLHNQGEMSTRNHSHTNTEGEKGEKRFLGCCTLA